jgi:hypothetical protein
MRKRHHQRSPARSRRAAGLVSGDSDLNYGLPQRHRPKARVVTFADAPDARCVLVRVEACTSAGQWLGFGEKQRDLRYFSNQSAHFGAVSAPHGMIGTVEVEFFGEPSISLSE